MKPTNIIRLFMQSIFCFTFLIGNAQQSPSPQFYLDTIFQLAKNTSVMTDSVDWNILQQEYYELGKNAKTTKDIIPPVKHLLKSLKDFHGRIWVNQIPYNGLIKSRVESDFELTPDQLSSYQQGTTPFATDVIKKQYGYILIPTIVMSDKDADRAKEIKTAICNLQKEHQPKGWILDLRLNGGGTMFPMLTGLGDLIGEDTCGYFINPSDNYSEAWYMKDGDFFLNDFQVTEYQLQSIGCENLNLEQAKVAVLISAATASSGEVVTLAFRNRPNTILIGENTSGYTTAVSWDPLSENVVIQLTGSYYADREKNIFTGNSILPDIHIRGGQNFENLEEDEMVKEAMRWLEKKD